MDVLDVIWTLDGCCFDVSYQLCCYNFPFMKAEECKEMEKALLENNGNTARHIPGPLPLREFISS